MTVAAVVIAPDVHLALADADGEPAVRRVAQAAWAGGALPLVVVCPEPAALAAALADLPVRAVAPPPELARGIGWFAFGLAAARETVAETAAGLLWPFRLVWVDPETITSLVEASGRSPGSILRPAYAGQPGLPALVPVEFGARLAALPELHGEDALERLAAEGTPLVSIELGDPGIVHDLATPRSQLPPYQGPPKPAGGLAPEWNEALAARAAPEASAEAEAADALEGPALAPYGQADDTEPATSA